MSDHDENRRCRVSFNALLDNGFLFCWGGGYFRWPEEVQEGDRPHGGICGLCKESIEGGDKYYVFHESLGHWDCVWARADAE